MLWCGPGGGQEQREAEAQQHAPGTSSENSSCQTSRLLPLCDFLLLIFFVFFVLSGGAGLLSRKCTKIAPNTSHPTQHTTATAHTICHYVSLALTSHMFFFFFILCMLGLAWHKNACARKTCAKSLARRGWRRLLC